MPFASKSLFGMSKLSVRWLRLGIAIQRIRPGHPEENGSHERMHRTLKAETARPPGQNILIQQEIFDSFRTTFNNERPHQALSGKPPVEVYKASDRRHEPILPDLEYPDDDYTAIVSNCGSISAQRHRVYIGVPFAGQPVGVTRIDDSIWRVRFMSYDLGFFDNENHKIQIPENPFLKTNQRTT